MSSVVLLFASIASSIPFGNSMRVTAHVKDTDGNPAVGVTVRVQTYKNTLKRLGREPEYVHYEGVTDTNGNATLSFQNYSCHFNMQAYSDNYYMESTNYVYINPVTTIVFAWLILSENITVFFLIGTALILVGMYLADRKKG